MFSKILIANRGEIAVRIQRTCRDMGIQTVAVHSTADADAMHVLFADESVCIGPPAANLSYLNIPAILTACQITGAQAVHPGYGFLAENPKFAEILQQHDVSFIGPSHNHISLMGDKAAARKTAQSFNLNVIPGSDGVVKSHSDAAAVANRIGYPVLLKAAAGGGGRGIYIANNDAELLSAAQNASNIARHAFGDPRLYIEKFLPSPRHIEVQILGDGKGNAVHIGERDCSIQRNRQKIFEESPSPALSTKQQNTVSHQAVVAAKKLKYKGAGTMEFLFQDNKFYFLEMNTRIQVEHPISEERSGLDLIQQQILVAAGEPLKLQQNDVRLHGHSIECRVNSENPFSFIPSPGTISAYHAPAGPGVRVDSSAYVGYTAPPQYDSLFAKIITYGENRDHALMRMKRALTEFVVEGLETNLPLHQALLMEPDVLDGSYNVNWLEKNIKRIQLNAPREL